MYRINDWTFEINDHDQMIMPENMNKFKVENGSCDYIYDIYIKDHIEITEDQFDYQKHNIKIKTINGLETRYLNVIGDPCIYAKTQEIDDHHSVIYVHQDYIEHMYYDTMFISLLSLERRMYMSDQYILHSSFMLYQDHAVLFSAPSGTGKSTQASLWEKYRHTRQINGDRSLIYKKDDQFYAGGWPVCGSSEICFNEHYPIRCIVVLSQGKVNHIERLSYKESFKCLMKEITINYHNHDFINHVMNFIDDLYSHVTIYHLTCDISEQAVECLENQMNSDQ